KRSCTAPRFVEQVFRVGADRASTPNTSSKSMPRSGAMDLTERSTMLGGHLRDLLEGIAVEYPHQRGPIEFDMAGRAEAGEGAAHRFRGQAEIVGNVGACHGEANRLAVAAQALLAPDQSQEERGDPLLRGLAAQHDHLFLGGSQLVRRHRKQAALHHRISPDYAFELLARHPADSR